MEDATLRVCATSPMCNYVSLGEIKWARLFEEEGNTKWRKASWIPNWWTNGKTGDGE